MLQLQLIVDGEVYMTRNTCSPITDDTVSELSDMIEWALEKKKINITALTKIMGVTDQTVRSAIKEKRDLRVSTFFKFVQAVDGEFSIVNSQRKIKY